MLRFAANEWLMQSLNMTRIAAQSLQTEKHAIICGYGRSGQNLAHMLEREGITYVALDLDPDRVRDAAAAGDTVVMAMRPPRGADCRRHPPRRGHHRHLCQHAVRAQGAAPRPGTEPALPVIVRTVDDSELDTLQKAGATEVVPEIIEGSLMLASHALVLLGVPMRHVLRGVQEARDARYSLLRGYFHGRLCPGAGARSGARAADTGPDRADLLNRGCDVAVVVSGHRQHCPRKPFPIF